MVVLRLSMVLIASTALAEPQIYIVDGKHTYPRFEYSHFGFSTQVGRFDRTSGTIVLDRSENTGSVDISIDAASVDTGDAEFNGQLLGEEFFDVRHFPTIVFRSNVVKFRGDKVISVDGVLTIKGLSRPVTLTVSTFKCMPHPLLKKEACGADAFTTIRRTEFNAGKYAPYIGDDVKLSIAVEAVLE